MNAMIGNSLLLSSGGYKISRSVRLRESAAGSFSRTFAANGDRRLWTWSGWIKRGDILTVNPIFGAAVDANTLTSFNFNGSGTLRFYRENSAIVQALGETTAVYLDPSAWYHIICVYDSAQAVAVNRFKIYVNGVQQTFTWSTDLPLGHQSNINTASQPHSIGTSPQYIATFDGYITEVNFIDGQALTPSSFGQNNPTTGVWEPIAYTGTYGTNGFYLNFSDNSSNTATTIGKDYSGNGNNWTPNNISVTSGVTYDSMIDVPTPWPDGGNGRGNYSILNPVNANTYFPASGNLFYAWQSGANTWGTVVGSIFVTTGKYYFETTVAAAAAFNGLYVIAGIVPSTFNTSATNPYVGSTSTSYGWQGTANRWNSGASSSYGTAASANDVIMVALDADNGKVWFGRNGTWFASGDPASGANASYSGLAALEYSFAVSSYSPAGNYGIHYANFGQRPFAYTPPSGFLALNTQNLPDPTIVDGSQYMDATLYTGNGTTQSVVNSGGMQPDFLWVKSRSSARSNWLVNSVTGASNGLISNSTGAEQNLGIVTSLNTDGFSVSTISGTNLTTNEALATYVGWQWKEGATQGFDIVAYTGDGASTRNISHSLGVVPSMVIIKNRSSGTAGWPVKHKSTPTNTNLALSSNVASTAFVSGYIQDLSSSSTFGVTIGSTDVLNVNVNGNNYIAYLFAEVAGFSAFGSYVGNNSADGPFVYCGFRPRFLLLKASSAAGGSWNMIDTERSPYNLSVNRLLADSSAAEDSSGPVDILSNGFKLRGLTANASAVTYIFAAFAENPLKYALAR
jgi:hypothetical protein